MLSLVEGEINKWSPPGRAGCLSPLSPGRVRVPQQHSSLMLTVVGKEPVTMAVYSAQSLLVVVLISAVAGAFQNRIIPSSSRLCSADDDSVGLLLRFFLTPRAQAANEQDVAEALLRAQDAFAADMGEGTNVC